MKTYLLTLTEAQEEVVKALAKALNFNLQQVTEEDEDKAILKAMDEGRPYGRLSDEEAKDFQDNLGK